MAKKWMKRLDKRWTYKPGEYSDNKFRLSRGAIEEYLKCKRCFYLYRKMGLKSAPSIPFVLNMAVDNLFKNEFDIYRRQQSPHPLMKMYGIDAVPYQHHELDAWRENFKGISVEFIGTDIEVFGAVDDIWVNPDGNLIVVDYKATAKSEDNMFSPINSWDNVWNKGVAYKRQLEIYQWLLFKRGFKVSKDCYLVYANANKWKQEFNNVLDFEITLLKHGGNFEWIDGVLMEIYSLLNQDLIPDSNEECDLCGFVESSNLLIHQN